MCIFADRTLVNSLESSFAEHGFSLVRARHGMHGYWLAVTSQPDVIITDTILPSDDSSYLLDCLERNEKTQHIPILAMLDGLAQERPAMTCLGKMAGCFLKTTPASTLIERIDALIERPGAPASTPRSTADHTSRFDAVFAELGHVAPKAPWSADTLTRTKATPKQPPTNDPSESKDHPTFKKPHRRPRRKVVPRTPA